MLFNNAELANPILSGVTIENNGATSLPAAPASVTTAGAGTYSVADILSGCILRDCAGAGRTDTTADAVDLIAGLPLGRIGARHKCTVVNVSDAAETITMAGGTGVTIAGSIAQGAAIEFTFIRTGTATIVVQGTSVSAGTITGNQTITGNLAVGGTLEVTGASTLAAVACTTLAPSGLSTLAAVTVTGVEKAAPSATPANITTAGAATYTAANLAVGVITRDPNGGNRTDTTDTAANLITGLALSADYQERYCYVANTSNSDPETITLAGGVGVTLKGAITVEFGTVVRLGIMRTGAAAVCIREA